MGLGSMLALQYALFVIIFFEGVSAAYNRLMATANLDVDGIHGTPSWWSKFKIVVIYHINVGEMKPPPEALPLAEEPSPHVRGLVTTWRDGKNPTAESLNPAGAIVVGTIRMGYGHHRIAYATTSWALGLGKKTYFHDLLNLDSEEASLIKTIDKFYSQISRIQAEFRAVELVWGYLMANAGNADLARQFAVVSAHFQVMLACVGPGWDQMSVNARWSRRRCPLLTIAIFACPRGFPDAHGWLPTRHAHYLHLPVRGPRRGCMRLHQGDQSRLR